MSKSHAIDWASDAPTPAQIKEFFAQIESRRITKNRLQAFLREKPMATHSTKHPLLDMPIEEFFTYERFKNVGLLRHVIGRAVKNALWIAHEAYDKESGKHSLKTVREFLAFYKDERELRMCSGVGVQTVNAIIRVIQMSGLPFEGHLLPEKDEWDPMSDPRVITEGSNIDQEEWSVILSQSEWDQSQRTFLQQLRDSGNAPTEGLNTYSTRRGTLNSILIQLKLPYRLRVPNKPPNIGGGPMVLIKI